MAIIRVNKTKDYITMSNHHLKEKQMSLKAKGLLSEMLSLPDNWDYSIQGLVAINKENECSIKATLDELKRFRYLIVTKKLPNETKSGRIEYIYDVYEKPKQEYEKQGVENLGVEFLGVENQALENQVQYNINNKILNNKILNNKILNNNKEIYKESFVKPNLEQVKQYCDERKNGIDAQRFIDFYESKGWMIGKNKMKDWKACVRTWEKQNKTKDNVPEWFDKDIKNEQMTQQEEQELDELLRNF